jgi:teichuronic acid biosynthesis glycosyltransferase TuaC
MLDPYHRVAVVTTSYPRYEGDWVGHFVHAEVLELRARGLDVRVITPPYGRFSAFGPPGAVARIAAFPPRVVSAGAWLARTCHALRHERVDRVVAHWAIPSVLVALQLDVDLEVVSHGSDVRLLIAAPAAIRRTFVRGVVSRAQAWRFVSAGLLESLERGLDAELARRLRSIAVVRAPSLLVPDVARRADLLRTELGPFHVTVGRLVRSKRVERAIDHAAEERALLVVVGEGPERSALQRHARRRGGRVQFVGDVPRAEALAYIAAADVLVLASEHEGCSTVMREAAALSTRALQI